MQPQPVMTDEFVAYLESGLSITVGTRDGALNPNGARAYAIKIHDDRVHLTAFLFARAAPAILQDLESHPEVALALDRPSDSRACQLKGRFVSSRRGRAAERPEIERQVNGFLRELEMLGIPRAMTEGWKFWPSVAIDVRITDIFEQTPGPGAGEPMR